MDQILWILKVLNFFLTLMVSLICILVLSLSNKIRGLKSSTSCSFKIARFVMFQFNLPSKFWGYSILHATYNLNRLPTAILNCKTPLKFLFKFKLDLNLLKTFGCLSFVSNLNPSKNKFCTRAFKCVLLGVALTQKGYILYNLHHGLILVSNNVTFYEN